MADKKISALTAATTPLAGTEVLPIVQGGATVKVSIDNLTAGKPVSMSNLTYTGTLTGSTGVINIGSGQVYKDASGNVGLGTATPNQKLQVVGSNSTGFAGATLQNSNGTVGLAGVQFSSDTTYSKSAIAQTRENANGNGPLVFYVDSATDAADWSAGDEKMRISADGNLSVGLTGTGGRLSVKGAASSQVGYFETSTAGFGFRLLTNGTDVGSIIMGASSTSFNTSSDYRLKENVLPMTGALEKVAALKPVTYTWKSTGEVGQGFIAHELQAVVPDCVTGEKDAVETVDDLDADGKKIGTKEVPRYQGVDTSFLVATLVAAVQEQQTLITQLQADVSALKGS